MARLPRSFVRHRQLSRSGFTLLELMVVVTLVGIVVGIAAPGWFAFLERQRLTVAQDTINQGLQQAKLKAEQTSKDWRFAMQQQGTAPVQWAVYSRYDGTGNTVDPTDVAMGINWQDFHPSIRLSIATSASQSGIGGDYYSAIFDYRGRATKRLTFSVTTENSPNLERCIIMSTLLGATRKDRDDGC